MIVRDGTRNLLSGLVEIDETPIRHRTGNGAVGRGRSHMGKRMIVGAVEKPAHNVLPWIHHIFSNFKFSNYKAWQIGVYHGLRVKHLQSCLYEFVFRFNRRRNRHAGLKSLLNLVMMSKPMTCRMLIEAEQHA